MAFQKCWLTLYRAMYLWREKNSTAMLVWRYRLLNYYESKGFVILEHNSKNLSSVSSEAKQRIHAINKQKTDFVMACYVWEFLVLRNHGIRVNYPYLLLGVSLMVILHYFIRKITIKWSNRYPFFLFMVNYHFSINCHISHFQKNVQNFLFP